ncbi:MAG TPA: hypothetical protein VL181_10580 [Holophagaceae bacterium]|nr:hypothetical protein [Holophagaceae bacterium]
MRSIPALGLSGLLLVGIAAGLGCQDFQGQDAGPGPGAPPQQLKEDAVWTGKTLYAGQAAVSIAAPAPRSGKPGAYTWTLQGAGTVSDPAGGGAPTGATVSLAPGMSAGGTTLLLSVTFYPSCGCTPETYAPLSLPISAVTAPMALSISGGALDATGQETMNVGGQDTFAASANPVPPGFAPAWTIQSVTPSVPDPGTLTPGAVDASGTSAPVTYAAPASAPSDFDVVVAATSPDPWFGGSATATATIHVKH